MPFRERREGHDPAGSVEDADGGVEELPCELGDDSGTPMLLVLTTVSPFWSVLSDYPEDDAVVLTPD